MNDFVAKQIPWINYNINSYGDESSERGRDCALRLSSLQRPASVALRARAAKHGSRNLILPVEPRPPLREQKRFHFAAATTPQGKSLVSVWFGFCLGSTYFVSW